MTTTPSRFEVDASIAIDNGGSVHLLYQDFLDADCKYYYMNNVSGSWSARQLIGTSSGKGSVPLIVITPDNQLHAFIGKGTIYCLTKPVLGGSWSSPVQVTTPTGGSFGNHAVVDASGGIYFMWGHLFDDSAPVRNGIYGRYKPLGGSWGATEVIAGHSSDGAWPAGDNLFADGNTIWVAISQSDRVYFKKRPPGGPWPGGNGVGTQLQSGGGGRFAQNPANPSEIAFAWGYDVDGSASGNWVDVFVSYTYDGGATWTAPYNVSNKTALDRIVEIAYDASGNLHAIWQGGDCDGCTLHMYYRARIGGTWQSRQAITDSSVGSGTAVNCFKAAGNTLHLALSRATNFWDVYYMSNVQAPPPPTPPTIYAPTLSHNPLVADDTIQHTLTLQATDINSVGDIRGMRWLVNFQGDNAGQHRGYVVWGQTPADIARYDGGNTANWSIAPVNAGSGYWGINTAVYGAMNYLSIRNVAESSFNSTRSVVFTFSVKPQFHTDGPLTNNDISVLADDSVSSSGWQNADLNFAISPANHPPTLDSVTIDSPMLLQDNATPYQITLVTSDGNGVADLHAMRVLINYQGSNAGSTRGYLAWGDTAGMVTHWDIAGNWTVLPVNSGSGYWGYHASYGGTTFIRPISAAESVAGNTRTVVFTFAVKPAWQLQGPVNDNDISGFAEDTYTTFGWQNFDLDFRVYPFPLTMPDFDRDTDVDQADFGRFQACISGVGVYQSDPLCGLAKLEGSDEDVDAADTAAFLNCLSGADIPATSACLP